MPDHTPFSLGEPFDQLLAKLVRSGVYASPADAVRAGLRLLEEYENRAGALRRALAEGEQSGIAGKLDMTSIKARARSSN